jgi:rRNA maturation endonuclease Nob1
MSSQNEIARIQKIMANSHVTTCGHCSKGFVALKHFDDCPLCGHSLVDDVEVDDSFEDLDLDTVFGQ